MVEWLDYPPSAKSIDISSRNTSFTYHEQARVGVDQFSLITGLQVPEDGGVVEVGQVDHVLALLKLGGVDATNLTSLKP